MAIVREEKTIYVDLNMGEMNDLDCGRSVSVLVDRKPVVIAKQ